MASALHDSRIVVHVEPDTRVPEKDVDRVETGIRNGEQTAARRYRYRHGAEDARETGE